MLADWTIEAMTDWRHGLLNGLACLCRTRRALDSLAFALAAASGVVGIFCGMGSVLCSHN